MPILDKVISIFAPFTCLSCGREGSLICSNCAVEACPILLSRCYRCRKPTLNFALCDMCRPESALEHVRIRTELNNTARALLYAFKFERAQAAAPLIAEYMAELVHEHDATLVPIPTATSRIRQRGYDHAGLLARNLSSATKLLMQPVLLRRGQSRQVGSKRSERLAQLSDSFHLEPGADVRGKHILLVDDVVTTGASLEQVARCLRRAGAAHVDAVVFAQKSAL